MSTQPVGDAKTNAEIGDCNLMILDYLEHLLKSKFEMLPKLPELFIDSLGPVQNLY
jgi:hypothetical protein